ncbi:transposon ty3-i Gag-Pol polyprotein [Plakobranchus ocellatus]|uniref:Transposon ty3-i Gag-Pol polyprotein n=1 Tax=Plakobranchus ocellatus TaxID=259542 RepID=A0AAV4BMG3_9GAST|nr:transposon ty3-i Gag-Pol polyprotein [Plakobranchus ocellatus]
MPFGMINSGAPMTRAVRMLVKGMDYVVDYVDYPLVHTPTWMDHVKTLMEIYRRLQRMNFTVRPKKCVLEAKTIDFLRHRLGEGAISFRDENVKKEHS